MSVRKKPTLLMGLLLIFSFLLPGLSSPSLAQAATTSKPTVSTSSASSIESDSATLSGNITSIGSSIVTEYGFVYGTDSSCSDGSIDLTGHISSAKSFSDDVSGLDSSTKYYFKAYATNTQGTSYGSVKYFTTTSASTSKPSVTTSSATDIGEDYATMNGKITSDGGGDITEYGFYYGTTSSCSTKKRAGTTDVSEGDSFSYDFSSLVAGTKYYFRAYATNSKGTSYGTVKYFTTRGTESKPTVTTNTPATGDGYATLSGVVTSNGNSEITSYGFYYGTSSSPSTKVEVGNSDIGEDVNYSDKLTGLSAGTTYYVKAYATNDTGTGYGSVLSFTVSSTSSYPSIFTIGSNTYYIKGSYQLGDVAPYIKNNRTYLPIHYVAWAMGITESNISWDEATQTVTLTKGSTVVKLTMNSQIMYVNGSPVYMDTVPESTANRTCLPIAFVVQAFGSTATWNEIAKTVTII